MNNKRKKIVLISSLLLIVGSAILIMLNFDVVSFEEEVEILPDVENRIIEVEVKSVSTDTSSVDFTYYNLDVQDSIQEQIDNYKGEKIDIDDMLLLFNPYGTNTTGLYVYFDLENVSGIKYTIETEGYNNYTQSVLMDEELDNVEFQIIGLVAGVENKITIECYDGSRIVENVTFTVTVPSLQGGYVNQIEVESNDFDLLDNGLYALLGMVGKYEGYTYFVDNYGTVRMEYVYDGDITETILFYEDNYVIGTDLTEMAMVNNLGKVVKTYDLGHYEIHHDYAINDSDEIIVLVTDPNSNAVEDEIISVDINTGEVKLLMDLSDVFPEYEKLTNIFGTDTVWQNYVGILDWMHINTLQLVNEDELILSSRETNTIIKLSNIYEDVQIDYLLADESIWQNTAYEEYLYTALGDFVSHVGQHTVTYLEDESLEEGQYYLHMYNNNYYNYESRSSFYGSISGTETSFWGEENSKSMYYMYLVDENEETYSLVNEIVVDYSSIVSSSQHYNDEIIINSGMLKTFYVYDDDNTLLATYNYTDPAGEVFLGYRVFKYSFESFYFE